MTQAASSAGHRAGWRYDANASQRDLRLDLLRGLCLLKMAFNHLPPTRAHGWQNWLGWVSAAEGFFFISGAVVGIVYGRKMLTAGWAHVRRSLVNRALYLYLANLALLLLFLGLEFGGILRDNRFSMLWSQGSFDASRLLSFNQPYYLHVLTRYVAFLLFAPLALSWLRAGRTRRLLTTSVAIYLLGWALGPNPRIPWLESSGYQVFPILIWQLLFFVGMACGYHRQALGRGWRRLGDRRLAWLTIGGTLLFVLLKRGAELGHMTLPPSVVSTWFGRTDLGPGRLLNLALFFAASFWLVDRLWKPVHRMTGRVLIPCGQASLYFFLVHIVVVVLGTEALLYLPAGLRPFTSGLLLFDLALVALMWAMVRYRVLYRFIPA